MYLRMRLESRGQADVFSAGIEMWFKGMWACPDSCLVIELHKALQPASVVIVAVRENGCIHGAQVYPHSFCIFGKCGRCTGIKQNTVRSCFDEQAETVFRLQCIKVARVLDKAANLHWQEEVSPGLFGLRAGE